MTTPAAETPAIAARFADLEAAAERERRAARGPRERELCGYGAVLSEFAWHLERGATPADVAELARMCAQMDARRLELAGFDPAADRTQPGRWDLWRLQGHVSACRTALEILAGAQS